MASVYRSKSVGELVEISDIDHCYECDLKTTILACNKCGNAVCNKGNCCMLFPHYNESLYVICRTCAKGIDKKLKVLVDLDKLKLLKKKIKKLQKENRQLRHSV